MLDKLPIMITGKLTRLGELLNESFELAGGQEEGHSLYSLCLRHRIGYTTASNWCKVARSPDQVLRLLIGAQQLTGESDAEFWKRIKKTFQAEKKLS